MKHTLFILFLTFAVLLGGCVSADRPASSTQPQPNSTEATTEATAEATLNNHLHASLSKAPTAPEGELTTDEVRKIALSHAQLTVDQVKYLRIKYDVDDGRPHYEVDFLYDGWEYEYDIDSKTGEIISFERDK